ncbi:hypothetical protein CSC2_05110 [Clostridium zeae]|uniref:Uncharacterized protein n=1 Tax=Clostridium zeae TaxID=2759022 RepID=A0ABQ1E5G5_9CLOT|nr:hypothetical protein CSC2_05110 [Clostridium zeae]
MFVGFIGIYYDNIILVTGGLIGFLILLGLYVILMKRYQRNKDNINYDKYKNDY